MNHFVPLENRTKKQQETYHRARRNTWGTVRPVTRIVESRKAYDRASEKKKCGERGGTLT